MNSTWGKVTINKIKEIDKKLKNNIGKKAIVKQQGKGKNRQLVVTGDPDKVEIESLKRKLKAEKKCVSQLQGEIEILKNKLRKEKVNARNSMYRLEETAKRQHQQIGELREKLDAQSHHHQVTLKYMGIEHNNNLQEVLNNSAKLSDRAEKQLKIGKLNLDLSRRTVEKAGSLENALRKQLELHFRNESNAIRATCKREVDTIKSQVKHEREEDKKEYEYILNSFKSFHNEKMVEAKQYKEELITLYKHCNNLTKTIKRMEEQAYPVRIKNSGLKMFLIPKKDKPNEFETYLDRRKMLDQQNSTLKKHTAKMDEHDDIDDGSNDEEITNNSSTSILLKERKTRQEEMREIEEKYLGRQWSDVSEFVQEVLENKPEKKPFVMPVDLHDPPQTETEKETEGNEVQHEFVTVGNPRNDIHRKVLSKSDKCVDHNTVIKHKDATQLILAVEEEDHKTEDEIKKLEIEKLLKEQQKHEEEQNDQEKANADEKISEEYDPRSNLTPAQHYMEQKKINNNEQSKYPNVILKHRNDYDNDNYRNHDSFRKHQSRPETESPHLDIPSTKKVGVYAHQNREHKRRKRPETARAVLMGRKNVNVKTMIFNGHVRNGGFDSPLREGNRKPYKPRMIQSARYRQSPRKKIFNKAIDQSVQTSRLENDDRGGDLNGGSDDDKSKKVRRERNIKSASRAYERRRKKGSLSPRRERKLRPQSAKAAIRHNRYLKRGKRAPFYTTVKDRSSFSPV